ncbi:hypothetical protein [Thermococcus sp.]|uniref:hypothetical protein n=1 Tax=Thermococcus sp. TaxID=35749 RepID=UPI00260B5E8A|nr:hypothetical protein [Thermococcus sp.]
MIGLLAVLLAGVVLKEWAFVLGIIPYLLRLKDRNFALLAFYAYAVVLAVMAPGVSLYTHEGFLQAVVLFTSTFLLLDEVLGGVRFNREATIVSMLLLASALNDYTFMVALLGATIYVARLRFRETVYYLVGWLGASALALYLLRNIIPDRVAQSFLIIGLGLVFLLLAERKGVDFLEVGLFEKK